MSCPGELCSATKQGCWNEKGVGQQQVLKNYMHKTKAKKGPIVPIPATPLKTDSLAIVYNFERRKDARTQDVLLQMQAEFVSHPTLTAFWNSTLGILYVAGEEVNSNF